MKKFKKFREWLAENYQDRESMFDYDDFDREEMYAAQEASANRLKQLVNLYNQSSGKVMSVSQKGEGYKDQRDSDQFALYIDGEEITEGDLDQLISRVYQICKEQGLI